MYLLLLCKPAHATMHGWKLEDDLWELILSCPGNRTQAIRLRRSLLAAELPLLPWYSVKSVVLRRWWVKSGSLTFPIVCMELGAWWATNGHSTFRTAQPMRIDVLVLSKKDMLSLKSLVVEQGLLLELRAFRRLVLLKSSIASRFK